MLVSFIYIVSSGRPIFQSWQNFSSRLDHSVLVTPAFHKPGFDCIFLFAITSICTNRAHHFVPIFSRFAFNPSALPINAYVALSLQMQLPALKFFPLKWIIGKIVLPLSCRLFINALSSL